MVDVLSAARAGGHDARRKRQDPEPVSCANIQLTRAESQTELPDAGTGKGT